MEEIDFSTLKTAGISQSDFAKIVGVSRAAVNTWCGGFGKIHPLRVARVTKFMSAISAALNDKTLPLVGKVASTNRVSLLRETLLTQLKKG